MFFIVNLVMLMAVTLDCAMDSYDIKTKQKDLERLVDNNRRQARLRNFYITILTGVALITEWLSNGYSTTILLYLAIGLTGLAFNLLIGALSEIFKDKAGEQRLIAIAQILLDLLLAAYVIGANNAIDSRASVLFAIPIIISGVLFSRKVVFVTAGAASLFYVGLLVTASGPSFNQLGDLLVPLFFYPAVFFVLAATTANLLRLSSERVQANTYDEVIALLTHQLRQPYGTIGGAIDLATHAKGSNLTDKQRHYLDIAKRENQRGLDIINNLLHMATIEKTAKELRKSDVDICARLRESSEHIAWYHERVGDLEFTALDSCTIQADKLKLGLALDNIIDNAFKFSPKKTPVRISIEERSDAVVVTVENQGEGVPPEKKDDLFIKYNHDSSKNYQGVGIGLYVSHQIVRAHNGEIEVESEPGKGALFRIIIPKGE